jgi:hypothetical protein
LKDAAGDPLSAILGSHAAAWQIAPPGSVTNVMGRPALNGGGGIVLRGQTVYGSDVEYALAFRLYAPQSGSGSLTFRFGVTNETAAGAPGFYIAGGAKDSPYATAYVYGTNGWKTYMSYGIKGVTTRSLGWPETLRKSVERDSGALPGLDAKWFTIRVVVRPSAIETYLDDRLLDIRSESGLNVSGTVRLDLSANADLASFRARKLSLDDPAYLPVALEGYLNAAELENGQRMAPDSLPPPATPARVRGIPFLFPASDSRGNDHIALRPSWAQFGALEGYVESQYGDFGGRWTTAFSVNPARIQLRAANDRFCRAYLVAAADDGEDSVPIATIQFFKGAAGYPKQFAARVPLFSASSTNAVALPARLENGRKGRLYLVEIPIPPGELAGFSDQDIVDIELTKEVKQFRSYPDPICYSFHQGGLPSSVHIYALTLERAPVTLEFKPDKFGHVWTAPANPAYTVALRNRTGAARNVELTLTTVSHDGQATNAQKQAVAVPAGNQPYPVRFTLNELKRYGYHRVILTMRDGAGPATGGDQVWTEERSLAWLHPETREKGGWEIGRGPVLGYWGWGGGHETPSQMQEMSVMAEAGSEICLGTFETAKPEVKAFAEKNGMLTTELFDGACMYYTAFFGADLASKYDPTEPEATAAALVETLRKLETKPSAITKPETATFFPEPGVGPSTYGNLPEYWGEPPYSFTESEEKNFKMYLEKFLLGAKAIRANWPQAKLLLPYGDPLFVVPFLRRSPEARALIDGSALDMPGFERMPEQQLHQVCHHRLYELREEYRKAGKPDPYFDVHEGTCAPTPLGALTWDEQADIYTRNFLIYFGYGVYRHPSGPTPFDCANYWGEEHYGSCGLFARLPYAAPKPSYVAYATLSRHLNRANFEKWLPTGSLSTYCQLYRHYKTGKPVYVLWTIRGKRPVELDATLDAKVVCYDEDDNALVLTQKEGRIAFTIDSSPRYIEGLTNDTRVTLGAPDHSDAAPAKLALKLGNLGDGSWTLSAAEDQDYADSYPLQVARFPGKMKLYEEEAPAAQGGKALAVHLGAQAKERKVMPWYTTLVPSRPVAIDGKASHLGLWVKAASDWGRVVYGLRDAKGEKWLSVGTREQWNCDDTHQWSFFNFDGWRYLRFEMPANAGYDSYRELGSTWWGHYGPGDGIVDLPVALEKIIVERRTHAMYVNDPQPARPDDVLLADLYAEYAAPFDQSAAVVAESRIRMPVPAGVPELGNPIKDLAAGGSGKPTRLLRAEPPAHQYDGTRCLVFFDKVAGATAYDVWVSPYPDGTGALNLGAGWKEPGQLLAGLRPEVDFYLFVVYTDAAGKASLPSAPLKIRLKDLFAMK